MTQFADNQLGSLDDVRPPLDINLNDDAPPPADACILEANLEVGEDIAHHLAWLEDQQAGASRIWAEGLICVLADHLAMLTAAKDFVDSMPAALSTRLQC